MDIVCCERRYIMQKKLLTKGYAYKRTDGYWGGIIYYSDEFGERQRKGFSGKTKKAVGEKIEKYKADFEKELLEADETKKALKRSMQNWLQVFKFQSVEQSTYDRAECTAKNQIYPIIGDKAVGDITAADIKDLLNYWMRLGYAHNTVKKVYILLNEYFRNIYTEGLINKNPMENVSMIKKSVFLSAQGKENLPECETITILTKDEIKKFKKEAFAISKNGKRAYKQAEAYILMLNTGLRIGEVLGVLNSDIDLERKTLNVERAVKVIDIRTGATAIGGSEIAIGKPKSATSKRTVPLNNTAIEMIKALRDETYLGEDTPLVCNDKGEFIHPSTFRQRFYKIMEGANIEHKTLHSLRHTFATNLINGIKQPDGTIRSLTPKQVADILGHSTSGITERYYVKKDTSRLVGTTDKFEL